FAVTELEDAGRDVCIDVSAASPSSVICPRNGGVILGNLNGAAALTSGLPNPSSAGHVVRTRSGASAFIAYRDGASYQAVTQSTTGLPNGTMQIGRGGTSDASASGRTISVVHAGGHLSENEVSRTGAAFKEFLVTLEAMPPNWSLVG